MVNRRCWEWRVVFGAWNWKLGIGEWWFGDGGFVSLMVFCGTGIFGGDLSGLHNTTSYCKFT